MVVSKDERYNNLSIFLSLIMDNKINEAYIDNLSKYMHLLAVNEIFEEIKKVKTLVKTINAINSLSKLYFSKRSQ